MKTSGDDVESECSAVAGPVLAGKVLPEANAVQIFETQGVTRFETV
jgi:hypothetical protein